ncbi:MAG TPA: glycosyltransferase family 39 protein, partial [Oligoflexia bacterium]|nr:glycosyltransferase family 39 protein [Oligoflexia bacterium]
MPAIVSFIFRWLLLPGILIGGLLYNLHLAFDSRSALSVYNLGIDTAIYDGLAWQAAQAGKLQPNPAVAPGFVFYLTWIYRWFGHAPLAAKLLNCMMIVLIALESYCLSRRMFGKTAGLLAALLISFSPMFHAYSATLQFEVLAAFLFCFAVSFLLHGLRRQGGCSMFAWSAASGLVLGCAVLTREAFLAVLPVFVLAILGSRSSPPRQRIFAALFFMLPVLLIAGFWIFSVYRANGVLVPVSAKGPINIEAGNNPLANGTFNLTRFNPQGFSFDIPDPKGWSFIRQRPLPALSLAGRKFLYFWGFLKDGWNVPRPLSLVFWKLAFGKIPLEHCQTLARSILALFFFAGLVLLARRPLCIENWFGPSCVFSVLIVHLILMSSHRYIIPVLPQVVFVASLAGAKIFDSFLLCLRSKRSAAAAAAILAVWAGYGLGNDFSGIYRERAVKTDGVMYSDETAKEREEGPVRFFDRARGPRPAVIIADEMLPQGLFAVKIEYRTDCASAGEPLFSFEAALGSDDASCRHTVVCNEHDSYQTAVQPCYLSRARVVKPVVYYLGGAGLWLAQVSFVLNADPSELEEWAVKRAAAADLPFTVEFNAASKQFLGEGWSGTETWADERTIQWAIGRTSIVFVPLATASEAKLNLQVQPFFVSNQKQRLMVLLNGTKVDRRVLD